MGYPQKAFSNDGIIALEIDDAGPTVAGIANDLLYSCFAPLFGKDRYPDG